MLKSGKKNLSKGARFGRRAAILAGVLLLIYILLYSMGRYKFETVFYQLNSPKVKENIRIVEIADLHNWTYGKNNIRLIEEIEKLKPDIITIAGDLINRGDEEFSGALSFCRALVEIAPVFYSFGNHENEVVYGTDITLEFLEEQAALIGTDEFGTINFDKMTMVNPQFYEGLREAGVTILNNNTAGIFLKDTRVDLAGVDNLSGTYFPYSSHMIEDFLKINPENVKLIVAHRPLIPFKGISFQEELRFDLALCGHTHGGIIRLPGMGGMFRMGGLWPWFTGNDAGMTTLAQGTVIVSRGLGNSNVLPRINNIPELVVVDISSQ